MPVVKIRNAADDGWITVGGTPEIVEQASEPATTYPGLIWHDTDATPATEDNAIHDNIASEISAITAKGTPVSGDFLLIEDSAASNVKKRITVGSLPVAAPTVDDVGIELDGSTLELKDNVIILAYQTASNGGTPTTGSWQVRPLNTEVHDPNGWCSIASNQFTLVAGTYIIRARAQFYRTNQTAMRLRNVTDATYWYGESAYMGQGGSVSTPLAVFGAETIASSKVYQVEYQCGNAPGSGLGYDANYATNTFMYIEITRVK